MTEPAPEITGSPREQQIKMMFAGELPFVTFTQYGPDGTVPLNVIRMYVCPICGTSIPVPFEERPEWTFPEWHVEDHLQRARMWDSLDDLRNEVRDIRRTLVAFLTTPNPPQPEEDWVGPHMAITYEGWQDQRPHSRACGIRKHDHGPDCHTNCPTCHGKAMADG